LYREMANASLKNAIKLLSDSRKLRKSHSRGRACALAVLSIEEASKAHVYDWAADGIVRIVKKNPNHITSYCEDDLKKHKYKHRVVKEILMDFYEYYPFYELVKHVKKRKITNEEFVMHIHSGIESHKRWKLVVSKDEGLRERRQRAFKLLERMDSMKNSGFYVDRSSTRAHTPDEICLDDLDDLTEMADTLVLLTHLTLAKQRTSIQKKALADEKRKYATLARRYKISENHGTSAKKRNQ